jgi:hypothetical protein
VSLIETEEHANTVLERSEVNSEVQAHIREKMKNYKSGKKCGNYIPALDPIIELQHRSPWDAVDEKISSLMVPSLITFKVSASTDVTPTALVTTDAL